MSEMNKRAIRAYVEKTGNRLDINLYKAVLTCLDLRENMNSSVISNGVTFGKFLMQDEFDSGAYEQYSKLCLAIWNTRLTMDGLKTVDTVCPKCAGTLYIKDDEISCENADPQKQFSCGFKLSRHVAGKILTVSEMFHLIKGNVLGPIDGFWSEKKNKHFSSKLEMQFKPGTKDYHLKFVK